ncbi:dTDP-glucose 4,6-dehydratase [bacterium]|nr:dTDP-glucose 4,6-dehydratase [bacterium]
METLLITGGAGFIGSNHILFLLERYRDLKIINLDVLTYAGNTKNLESVKSNPKYVFVQGDIGDRDLIESLFKEHDIRGVIHFAAESHVDNSISEPEIFIRTNVLGTFTLIDVARNYWMDEPFQYKPDYENCRFHHISTDEVYGTLGETGLFTEETPYAPNSPYSASKAGSDFVVRSYHHTYGMNVVMTNCSNNYGPMQHEEKLIPVIIRCALAGNRIPIYGNGKNIRDWLYVKDHCRGIDLVYRQGKNGESYNIGGRNEKDTLEIAETVCGILDELLPNSSGKSYADLIAFITDRPGHDKRYAIDATKIESELGWKAEETFESGIRKTIQWYLNCWM